MARLGVLLALILVLSVPFAVRAVTGRGVAGVSDASSEPNAEHLVIVTPHVEQIQYEFARAFDRWYQRNYHKHAYVDWRTPGGTSEIIKQLEASFDAAVQHGRLRADGSFEPGTADYDLFFGGGSYEHGKMKQPHQVTIPIDGRPTKVVFRMGRPAEFSQATLDEIFGENQIGAQHLYDPDKYWIGTALSGFGIVYNRDVLKSMGLPEPKSFLDLCDPRYFNMVALTDGRLSGSVTTTYDSIMNKEGWDKGWRLLREMSANARYFASSSTRAPIDVSQGEAAAGLAIDFYGRTQGQFLLKPGQAASEGRVGYVDPAGAVYIDADPISILNGTGHYELAKSFVGFCLSDEAQALWQFPARSRTNPPAPQLTATGKERDFGPEQYELRRMPVRRAMYAKYMQFFTDKNDPFEAASEVQSRGWRALIAPLMAAFAIDNADVERRAWRLLNEARQAQAEGKLPGGASDLAEMEKAFYAMPMHQMQLDTLLFPKDVLASLSPAAAGELGKLKITTVGSLRAKLPILEANVDPEIIAEWKALLAGRAVAEIEASRAPTLLPINEKNFQLIQADTDRWGSSLHARESLIRYTQFFRRQYNRVIELAKKNGLS